MESCFEKINDSPKCFGEVFKLKGVFINIMLAIDELVYIKLLTLKSCFLAHARNRVK